MHGEAQGKPKPKRPKVNELGYEIKLTAINHWDVAIATHSRNHEDVTHHCQSIETLDPSKIITGGRLQTACGQSRVGHDRGGQFSRRFWTGQRTTPLEVPYRQTDFDEEKFRNGVRNALQMLKAELNQ